MDISTPTDDTLGAADSHAPKPKPMQSSKKAKRPSGALSRYLFTASALLGIILSAYAFLWLIGRSTDDAGSRLNLPQRSTEQVYYDAESIALKSRRLRALQNFVAAYPDSQHAAQAQTSIEALSADEYQGWLTLSDVFYDARARRGAKLEALELYIQEWGGGTYEEQLNIMSGKLQEDTQELRRLTPRQAPGLTRQKASEAPPESLSVDSLAGAAPEIEIYKPAATTPVIAPPEPQPLIIEAVIIKDKKPKYPSRALRRGITATVTISMNITTEGRVKDVRILQAATGKYAREFGISALRAAKRTRFDPKTIDGKPVPTNGYTRQYTFEITEEE